MKRLIALLAASLAAFIMSAAPAPITKDYNLKGFTGLHVSGLVSVELTKSPDWKVSVTLPPELEEYLVVKTSGGNLSISLNNVPAKVLRRFRDLEIKAEIAMPELRTLEMSGATSLSCGDTFDIGSETFKIEVSGASKVKQLGINAKDITLKDNHLRIQLIHLCLHIADMLKAIVQLMSKVLNILLSCLYLLFCLIKFVLRFLQSFLQFRFLSLESPYLLTVLSETQQRNKRQEKYYHAELLHCSIVCLGNQLFCQFHNTVQYRIK